MAIFYLDTSALVKRYVRETGSDWVDHLVEASAGHTVMSAAIARVEVAAAVAARHRAPPPYRITRTQRDQLLRRTARHFSFEYVTIRIEPSVLDLAVLLLTHHRLRGYDAVHLAAALRTNAAVEQSMLGALTFVASDNDLLAAAQREGLLVDDPNRHP